LSYSLCDPNTFQHPVLTVFKYKKWWFPMLVTWPTNYSGDTIKVYFEPLPKWWHHESLYLEWIFNFGGQKRLFSPLSRKNTSKNAVSGGNLLAYNFKGCIKCGQFEALTLLSKMLLYFIVVGLAGDVRDWHFSSTG